MQQFTKRAIVETFLELLNEKPLEKITVKEVVERCGINRNTFYYHFEDLHALLLSVLDAEAEKVLENCVSVESMEEGFIAVARFAMENKRAAYHIYHSVSREDLERYLERIALEVLKRLLENITNGIPRDHLVKEEDMQLILHFYKNGLVGVITDWLSRGMKDDPEQLVRRLSGLLTGSMRKMVIRT